MVFDSPLVSIAAPLLFSVVVGCSGQPAGASAPEYETLRNLVDEGGVAPVTAVKRWEEVLPSACEVFTTVLKTVYRPTFLPQKTWAGWTPFVVAEPGIVPGHRIEELIPHVGQLPALFTRMRLPLPSSIQGRVLNEIFTKQSP